MVLDYCYISLDDSFVIYTVKCVSLHPKIVRTIFILHILKICTTHYLYYEQTYQTSNFVRG